MNIKGLMPQPIGPEALGWFRESISSMDDMRNLRLAMNAVRSMGASAPMGARALAFYSLFCANGDAQAD